MMALVWEHLPFVSIEPEGLHPARLCFSTSVVHFGQLPPSRPCTMLLPPRNNKPRPLCRQSAPGFYRRTYPVERQTQPDWIREVV